MKKTLAFLITLAMAISMFAMTTSAAMADDFYHPFSYDFEDREVGDSSADFAGLDCMLGHQIKDVGGDHGKVFAFTNENKEEYQIMFFNNKCKANGDWHLAELPRQFTFSVDINIKALTVSGTEYNFQAVPHLNNNGARSADRIAIFGTNAAGEGLIWGAGDAKVAYTPGEWFKFETEFDLDANTKKSYINGELVLDETLCVEGTDMSTITMTCIQMSYRNISLDGQEMLIDNLSIVEGLVDRTPAGDDEGSPETADFLSVAIVVASISLAGVAVAKKRR